MLRSDRIGYCSFLHSIKEGIACFFCIEELAYQNKIKNCYILLTG